MPRAEPTLDGTAWLLLVFLSVLWGASFFFVGVALRELPPLTIVLARVGIAALLMLPIAWVMGVTLPRSLQAWWPFLGMAMLNNVFPHSLIVMGQTHISSSLASVLNATTPLFSVLVMAAFREEALTAPRVIGVLLGIAGGAVLRGIEAQATGETMGILLCLGAAMSYGFAGLWGRRMLKGVNPVASATGQLIAGTVVMLVVASAVDRPWTLPAPSQSTIAALLGFAALSTALAYVVFFEILARAGATNVMLVTLLIPVTAILLGYAFLGEIVGPREIAGALLIGGALLMVDGRALQLAMRRTPR